MTVTRRQTCRLCNSRNVECVVELSPIPLSENYSYDQTVAANAPRYPVDVFMCGDCGHVQQVDIIDPKTLWDSYTYFSGDAKGMPEHFQNVAAKAMKAAEAPAGSLVVDIGSNDGSLLKPFKAAGHRVLGIDPATDAAKRANDANIPTITSLMTRDLAKKIREEDGPAHIICAFNVFAHADDLGEMVDCVREMLAPDGLFFFEAQYLLDIVDGMLVATLFHEHLSHHSVKPLISFLDRHGLQLIAVERAAIQHGSLIGTVQLKGSTRPVQDSVNQLVALETERKLDELETLHAFGAKVKELRARTAELVARLKAKGATIAGYGAARSGPTLIIQMGLTGKIDYIVDDHPQKVGRYASGAGNLVVPTAELIKRMPDYTIILAWVHSKKIIETNQDYLNRGGHFIVLCPETRVVGKDGDVNV
ncbi:MULTISPECIES: class I SAM-dependent methyltransferase [unclassified Bradyrhizobium]|uniref:class I SAM-dependent methyltransferase n=1 Tax=unclassified Bradyrhizobium TaxID=2631580 RepID=UPI0028EE7682|nr:MULTISPECIES: class I SAM-dependent methyltransferase [unclassified Bradyrhizobium]